MSLRIRSRHPSADAIRGRIRTPFAAIYRHGSTSTSEIRKEINSIQSVKNAASKLLMKQCFDKLKVKHLPWFPLRGTTFSKTGVTNGTIDMKFPVIIKHHHGSRGNGNHKIDTAEQYETFVKKHQSTLGEYIVEKFFSGTKEYRVHITAYGPIYSLRKMLKEEVPDEKRWVRNDSTCVWIMEKQVVKTAKGNFLRFSHKDGEKFEKPKNWNLIIEECQKALQAVGLDLGACDIKTQSKGDDFYIIEINSAPSLGEITAEVYKQELPKILTYKYDKT